MAGMLAALLTLLASLNKFDGIKVGEDECPDSTPLLLGRLLALEQDVGQLRKTVMELEVKNDQLSRTVEEQKVEVRSLQEKNEYLNTTVEGLQTELRQLMAFNESLQDLQMQNFKIGESFQKSNTTTLELTKILFQIEKQNQDLNTSIVNMIMDIHVLKEESKVINETLLIQQSDITEIQRWSIDLNITMKEMQEQGINFNTTMQAELARLQEQDGTLDKRLDEIIKIEGQNEVAFSSRLNKSQKIDTTNDPVIFDVVLYNGGAMYDQTTGKATIPENGTYVFFFTCMAKPGKVSRLRLVVDNSRVEQCWGDSSGLTESYQTNSRMLTMLLIEGSQVYVGQDDGDSSHVHGYHTTFSGYKL